MSDTSQPPAGWYEDPQNPAENRWWNGAEWTEHKQAKPVTTPPPTMPPLAGTTIPPRPTMPPIPEPNQPAKRGISLNKPALLVLAVVVLIVLASIGGSDSPSGGAGSEPIDTGEVTPPRITAPQFTRSEDNAIRSAEQYISLMAFSRSGLIEQLEYEGFSTAEATLAVDEITVNWNEQAWKSAEQYLSLMTFSRSGLIEQLEYEGFTKAQATYGVNKAGL